MINWHWLEDLKVFAVRREFWVDYMKNLSDFKTWPVPVFQDMVQKPFINRSQNNTRTEFAKILKREFDRGYPNFRPQFPTTWWMRDSKRGGWMTFHLKYKREIKMKKKTL